MLAHTYTPYSNIFSKWVGGFFYSLLNTWKFLSVIIRRTPQMWRISLGEKCWQHSLQSFRNVLMMFSWFLVETLLFTNYSLTLFTLDARQKLNSWRQCCIRLVNVINSWVTGPRKLTRCSRAKQNKRVFHSSLQTAMWGASSSFIYTLICLVAIEEICSELNWGSLDKKMKNTVNYSWSSLKLAVLKCKYIYIQPTL